MPISEDTAALVAAQLTVATTNRMLPAERVSPKDREQEIANIYDRTLERIRASHGLPRE